jgi:AcrR family transcriptional regulator
MPTIDTRELIIDVARRLFAQQGIENTTIGDVATASNRSRRTIYTYFKSKEELLEASIESEMKKISAAMKKVASEKITPDKKLIKLIFVRLRITRSIVRRNSGLHTEYFGNMWIVEHIRRTFDRHEIALFRSIIADGQQQGIFNVESPDLTARFLHFCLNGLEVPFIKGVINKHKDEEFVRNFSEKIILSALGAKVTQQ